jgi:hypothetical protein
MTSRLQLAFPWSPASQVRGRSAARRAPSKAPRIAPSAVRIPDPRLTELPLQFAATGPQIFVHEGARQALERRFELRARRAVQLAVTDNRQRIITRTVERGRVRVRVHMMFLDAPEHVQEALVGYVLLEDRDASRVVDKFIASNRHRIRASRPVRGPLNTRGDVHDLLETLGRLNARYLGGSVDDVLITWGRRTRTRGQPRRTIKLGSYSTSERLIRIHPVLDRQWVPRYFMSYVVYHELLHHVLPPTTQGGRSVVHSPEFLRREREYRYYERAIEWERSHLSRLLRA